MFETKDSEMAGGAEKYATDKADTTEESEEKKYFPKGEAPYRDVDVVSETDEGKNPRFIRTAAESEFTSEEMAKRLLEIAEEGSAAYDTYTDSEAVSDANRWFETQGNDLDKAAGKIEELIDAGALTSKKNFAKAQLVYNKLIEEAKNTADEYAAEKLLKRAENMIINVAMAGTRAGQTVQAMRLLKRLSPEGRLIALEKSVDELNSQRKHKQPKEQTAKTEKIKKGEQRRVDAQYRKSEKRTLREQLLARLKEIGTDEAEQAIRNYGAEKEAGATAKKAGDIDTAKFEKIKKENFSELDISKMSVSELETLLAQLDEEEAEIDAELAEIDKELAELEKPTVEEERKVQLSETEKRQKKRAAEAEAESKAELTKAKKNYDRVSAKLDEANKIIADRERTLARDEVLFEDQQKEIQKQKEKAKDLAAELKKARSELKKARKDFDINHAAWEAIEEFYRRVETENKSAEIYIPQDLKKAILKCKTEEELDAVMARAVKTIAAQMPPHIGGRRWRNAWRYMAMLLNPTTHGRNVYSNIAMYLTVGVKDLIEGAISDVYYSGKRKGAERNNSFVRAKMDKETRKWINTDLWPSVSQSITESGISKGRDRFINDIMKEVKPFVFDITNKINDLNSRALEAEDVLFLKLNFARAFEKYMAANKLTRADIENQPILMENATRIAAAEAREATFRDVSTLANAIRNFSGKHPYAGEFFFGGFLPFTRTPFNIAKRGVEYSPLGLGVAAYKALAKDKDGVARYSKNETISSIAKGLTGSAYFALGMLLRGSGLLFVSGSDPDDEDKYRKERGEQNFSLKIGGYTFTIDWLQPSSIPLLSGASLMKMFEEAYENSQENVDLSTLISFSTELAEKAFEPLIQTSVLSGFSDALEAVREAQSDSEVAANLFKQVLSSYAGQYIPTVVGKIARSIDPSTRRYNFVPADSKFPEAEYFVKKTAGKIPFLTQTNPEYVDMFGRTAERKETAGDYLKSFAYNMLSPMYIDKYETDEVDEELIRLSKTAAAGGKQVLNPWVKKTVKINRGNHDELVSLSGDEYFEIKKRMGQFGTEAVRELIESDVYKGMSDEARAEATDMIWNTAYQSAVSEVIPDYYMSKDERITQSIANDSKSLASYAASMAIEELSDSAENVSYTPEQKKIFDESLEELYSRLSGEASTSGAFDGYSATAHTEADETLYSYAKARARLAVEDDYELSGNNKKLYYLEERTDVSPAEFIALDEFKKAADEDGNGKYTQSEIGEALRLFGEKYGASYSDLAYIWQLETDGLTKNNPYGAYLDPKFYKSSGKQKRTWER